MEEKEKAVKGPIEKKWLEGLKFQTSKAKETEENGRKRTVYVPVEQPLTPEDVLDWKDTGGEIIIVAKDGTKHVVENQPQKKVEKPPEKKN